MARQMKFVADCLIADCAKESYDLVALPGGMPGGWLATTHHRDASCVLSGALSAIYAYTV